MNNNLKDECTENLSDGAEIAALKEENDVMAKLLVEIQNQVIKIDSEVSVLRHILDYKSEEVPL